MSDSSHLLIPFASVQAEACREASRTLALPNLERLLARLAPGPLDAGDAESLSMPHERVIAKAAGVTAADGCIPLAAMHGAPGGASNEAWAWITPCHWQVGIDHIAMTNPDAMNLSAEESQAVLAAVRPYFEEDGIAVTYESPLRWLARGDIFRDLPTASLDRVAGRVIDAFIPRSPKAGPLRRLQQETQMLLYTHAVSDAREASGQAPVNSFWVSAAGALPDSFVSSAIKNLQIDDRLRASALQDDAAAWTKAWHAIDTTECARLVQQLDIGQAVSLTLCGERSAQTWRPREGSGFLAKIGAQFASIMGRKQVHAVLEAL